jgi:hypothetical protein
VTEARQQDNMKLIEEFSLLKRRGNTVISVFDEAGWWSTDLQANAASNTLRAELRSQICTIMSVIDRYTIVSGINHGSWHAVLSML